MSVTAAEKARFVQDLTKELREENLAIFAGAGLSVSAGFVNWSELLKPIAEELNLDIEREVTDLISLVQYHCNVNGGNRSKLNQLLIDQFCGSAKITTNHEILARLPINTFWTTNYDNLIETALSDSGKVPDVKHTNNQLVHTKRKRDAVIYKMHGDANHPSEAVLTKDDYEKYHVDMQPFLGALTGDLISRTFLFLGFSFTDPNLDYILSRVRVSFRKNQRQHNCILRTVNREPEESEADFEYRKRKQELFIQDLLRFGIKTLLVDEYSEVTDILHEIEKLYRRKTVFISGAAHEYSPYNRDCACQFVYKLSQDLVKSDFRIVSGFGLGIGSSVITGVLNHVYMSSRGKTEDHLVLRPFPQDHAHGGDLAALWTDYRKDMIVHTGIALFLFGNKVVDNRTCLSHGMREEFEIAKAEGLFLLPVGATGSMAKELWDEVSSSFDEYNGAHKVEIKEKFKLLGNVGMDLDSIHEHIMALLELLCE
ncbi:MAG: SIR2 family protein [Gammaproteobacteria bacterium]|nr:SIR2 family protein [Gammaproteobacteria bacterium]